MVATPPAACICCIRLGHGSRVGRLLAVWSPWRPGLCPVGACQSGKWSGGGGAGGWRWRKGELGCLGSALPLGGPETLETGSTAGPWLVGDLGRTAQSEGSDTSSKGSSFYFSLQFWKRHFFYSQRVTLTNLWGLEPRLEWSLGAEDLRIFGPNLARIALSAVLAALLAKLSGNMI